jgi:hypothetical protein
VKKDLLLDRSMTNKDIKKVIPYWLTKPMIDALRHQTMPKTKYKDFATLVDKGNWRLSSRIKENGEVSHVFQCAVDNLKLVVITEKEEIKKYYFRSE